MKSTSWLPGKRKRRIEVDGQMTWAELKSVADGFWEGCEEKGNLQKAMVPFCQVLEIKGLSYFKLKKWYTLNQPWRKVRLPDEDRLLHGFFDKGNGSGKGVIFLNKDDDPPEKRFSLAHELAHFLVEYDRHRKWAEETMGTKTALDFLENRTKTSKRTQGLLYGVTFGPFSHFLEMDNQTGLQRYSIAVAERNADLLACELLAPRLEVLAVVASRNYRKAKASILQLLLEAYALPERPALNYAEMLAEDLTGGPSFEDWLGMNKGQTPG